MMLHSICFISLIFFFGNSASEPHDAEKVQEETDPCSISVTADGWMGPNIYLSRSFLEGVTRITVQQPGSGLGFFIPGWIKFRTEKEGLVSLPIPYGCGTENVLPAFKEWLAIRHLDNSRIIHCF